MKEKIENINYEQINKEFQEIEITLETLKNEMEDMVEEFNNKYEKIIREKKQQKIAEDLLNGNYNKNPDINKYDLLNNIFVCKCCISLNFFVDIFLELFFEFNSLNKRRSSLISYILS